LQPPVELEPGHTPVEKLLDAEAAEAARAEKKRAGKRRRRGKRAGALVAARDEKRNAQDDDDGDDGEEEENSEEVMRSPPTPRKAAAGNTKTPAQLGLSGGSMNSPVTSTLIEGGWIDAAPDAPSAGEQAARLAAHAATGRSSTGAGGLRQGSSLVISDDVLGYGSSGTVVFRGTFQGRAVAVKRLLRDFVNVASKEVSLLESADNHPHVIRYFYKELTGSFLYIALELCPASLSEVIEKPGDFRDLAVLLEPKKALAQITSGLQHLHSLSIVHRDIKPQNILVSLTAAGKLKMLLSDFGLSKRLDGLAQTSFSQTMNNPGGTVGWRAPEILRGDISLDAGGDGSASTESSFGPSGAREREPGEERRRLTRAVDVFALGCLAYYVLANGEHPFGTRFEREMNIVRGQFALTRLSGLGEEGYEAQHLISAMISANPRERPDASDVLSHPYFWNSGRRLAFLQDASDRFEIMDKEHPPPALVALEQHAADVVGADWHRKMDKLFLDDLGKFRKYERHSVQDLLRALRNKKHHYQDMSPQLRKHMGALPDGFLAYFTRRFPALFLHVHSVVAEAPLLRTEAMFAAYFTPPGDFSS
jgi:serine/threonine-protein kinase/endoribonuclease IRE1